MVRVVRNPNSLSPHAISPRIQYKYSHNFEVVSITVICALHWKKKQVKKPFKWNVEKHKIIIGLGKKSWQLDMC